MAKFTKPAGGMQGECQRAPLVNLLRAVRESY
jgi:hypothetical protein